MKLKVQLNIDGKVLPEIQVWVNDKNGHIHTNDGFIDAHINWNDGTGSFCMPSMNWGGPVTGDILDCPYKSGKVYRCVVTYETQDNVARHGKIQLICEKSEWNAIVLRNKIIE